MGKKRLMKKTGASCVDLDVILFITESGITDAVEKAAVCKLVTDFKSFGLWEKFTAIYPFLGSSKTTGKFNLKNPYAYNLTFTIGNTDVFSNMGYLPNYGSSTGILETDLTYGSTHLSVYSRTDLNSSLAYDFYSGGIQMFSRLSNIMLCDMYSTSGVYRVSKTNNNSIGFNLISRTLPNRIEAFKNGTSLGFENNLGGALSARPLLLGTDLTTSPSAQKRQYAFASVGLGLSAEESFNLNSAVLTFVTSLGRNL